MIPLTNTNVVEVGKAPPDQRFDQWRDLVRQSCGPLKVLPGGGDFAGGTIMKGLLGGMHVSVIDADPHSVVRTERLIRSADGEFVYLCGVLEGSARVEQGDRQAVGGAGELISFDSTRPYTLTMPEKFRMIALMFPHKMVGLTPSGTRSLTAKEWPGRSGVEALLFQLLSGLSCPHSELSPTAADSLGTSVASLVSSLFAERLHLAGAEPCAARQALMLRVQAFGRQHLADPRLDPQMLAQRHGVSLRYLQNLFQEQGTSPARWIRDERLTRCHEDLRTPQSAHLTVATIGERWGLPGPSHFTRLFRDRYGVTPSDFRKGEQLFAA
jgi:AraC-like DNA-binding protein